MTSLSHRPIGEILEDILRREPMADARGGPDPAVGFAHGRIAV